MAEGKTNSLDAVMKGLNKEFGEGTIAKIEDMEMSDIEVVPTNCLSLDFVLGCKGLPKGRIIEIYGEPSAGKSVMSAFIVSQIQKAGGKAVWLDAEFSFSKDFYHNIGVDTDQLILSQPGYGEQALTTLRRLVETGEVDIIVVDSVASLVPKKELDGELEKQDMALQARMMSKALRVTAGIISQKKTTVIFINQMRDKVGIVFGKKESTPGGKALKFYSSIRLEVKKGENIRVGGVKEGEVIGNVLKINGTKNKVGVPFREAKVELYYKTGLDKESDLIDFAIRVGVIKQAGSSYSFGDIKLGAGKENAKSKILSDEGLYNNLLEEAKKFV